MIYIIENEPKVILMLNENFPQASSETLALFKQGLLECRPLDVAQALSMGVEATTNIDVFLYENKNPLIGFLRKNMYWLSDANHKQPRDVELMPARRLRISAIVDILLSGRQDFVTKDIYGQNLADQALAELMGEEDLINHTKILIASLNDAFVNGRKLPKIDFDAIFMLKGGYAREEGYKSIAQVLNCVKERLRNPETCLEQHLIENYKEVTQVWLDDLTMPAFEDLPAYPNPATKKIDAFIKSVSNLSQAFGGGNVFDGFDDNGSANSAPTPQINKLLVEAEELERKTRDHLIEIRLPRRAFE